MTVVLISNVDGDTGTVDVTLVATVMILIIVTTLMRVVVVLGESDVRY